MDLKINVVISRLKGGLGTRKLAASNDKSWHL